MNPEVSVIIPAYNTEKYLAQALSSALNQTLTNIEVIVVNDLSTDNTLKIAKSFNDSRLKVLSHEKNMGAGAARNTALNAATGKWIAVLDSDDWFDPHRLEHLIEIANQQETEFIADDLYFVDDGADAPHGTLLEFSEHPFHETQFVDPLMFVETGKRSRLAYTKPLIRRDFLAQHQLSYDPSLRLGQDYWFYMQCFLKGARFLLVPKPYYFYRLRPDSLVNQSSLERFEGFYRTAQKFLQYPEVQKNPDMEKALTANMDNYKRNCAYYRVVNPLKRRQWKEALQQLMANPLFWLVVSSHIGPVLRRRWEYYVGAKADAFETRAWGKAKHAR